MKINLQTVLAVACIYVAVYGLPSGLEIPNVVPTPPKPDAPSVRTPSMEMQRAVAEVADICERMDTFDRLVWAATWTEAAEVIAGESDEAEVTIDNTLGLRVFTGSVLEVAWSRLAQANGKYRGLDDAVERLFADVIGNDVRPFDNDLQDTTVELYEALAWAGANEG